MKLSELNLLSIGNTIQLAGAAFVGEGKLLLCLFPEDSGAVYSGQGQVLFDDGEEKEVHVLDMDSDDWAKFLRQTDILEVEVLQKASDGKLAKAILRKSARQIEARVSWQVFKRDGYACRYCGRDDVPLTIDHLVLWEEGGPSIPTNLLSACKKCNKTRGNTQYADWLKDPYYLRVSSNLRPEVKADNEALVGTLDAIPRNTHQRSR